MSKDAVIAELTAIGRVPEVESILTHVANARCCSLVGVSNMGKSMLLRALPQPALLETFFGDEAQSRLLIYIDCNRMLQLTEQGLYEMVLRCLREAAPQVEALTRMDGLLEQAYNEVVRPSSPLAVPLAFNRALSALLEPGDLRVTLILDEFDDPLRALDGRVLLNLRALHDQYAEHLVYVTATGTDLALVRQTRDAAVDEFCELFAAHVVTLGPMNRADSLRWLDAQLDSPVLRGAHLSAALKQQLAEQAGGHLGLLGASLHCVTQGCADAAGAARLAAGAALAGLLDQDPNVQLECEKLWDALSPQERRALEQLTRLHTSRQSAALRNLMRKGLVHDSGAQLVPFAPIWERYVQHHAEAREPHGDGVRIDDVYGEVWVDGRTISYLTPLEHRLLMALYERTGQICTKEEIVEAVYGRPYIDSDLPALQRLVHRLRAKIEADPSRPTHVVNVRGYGYKLVANTA